MKKKLTVSVDFDGTLRASGELQDLVATLVKDGVPVMITTRRSDDKDRSTHEFMNEFPPDEVWELANELGINTVNFTHGQYKNTFFEGKKDIVHIDDDPIELTYITIDNMMGKNGVVGFNIFNIDKFEDYIWNHIKGDLEDQS